MQKLLADPPPEHLFEMTEYALASGNSRRPGDSKKEVLLERSLVASPIAPNVLHAELYREALAKMAGAAGRKAHSALIIPDYATRMSVLEFDQFPQGEQERIALVRFRLRKNVPFPIDEAQLSYAVQYADERHVEVLAIAIARPILEDYERIFSDAGYRLGLVLPSIMAALWLCPTGEKGLTLVAKSTGFTLSVVLLGPQRIRLIRCVDLASEEQGTGVLPQKATASETEAIMMRLFQQTVAYAEDQLGSPVTQAVLSGFESETQKIVARIKEGFGVSTLLLRSKLGNPTIENAGMLALLDRYAV